MILYLEETSLPIINKWKHLVTWEAVAQLLPCEISDRTVYPPLG